MTIITPDEAWKKIFGESPEETIKQIREDPMFKDARTKLAEIRAQELKQELNASRMWNNLANRFGESWQHMKDNDPVNHPNHYTKGKVEVWDFIADQEVGYFLGNVIKYVVRAGHKEPDKELQDLKKAQAYLNKYIELMEEGLD